MPAINTASAISAGATSVAVASPATMRISSATIGRPSFMNTFQMPVTKIDSVTAGTSKPHESVMAYVAPTPTAPPNGTTFDTALPGEVHHERLRVAQPGQGGGQHTGVGEQHQAPQQEQCDELAGGEPAQLVEDLAVLRLRDGRYREHEDQHGHGEREHDLRDAATARLVRELLLDDLGRHPEGVQALRRDLVLVR